MLTKAQRHEESSLLGTARVCYFTAFVCLATFIYSLVAPVPASIDQFTRFAEEDHFQFLVNWRWLFLVACALFVIAGLSSVAKANRIR